ncbi:MAG: hypothetical protein IKF90_04465 [Parasporobacterium sp.]|nr:hypothetical protein [Parasporobacterium sp.]
MKKTNGTALRIWSFIMIPSGIFCIVLDVMLMLPRFRNPEISKLLAFTGVVLLLFCGVLEILAGISGIGLLNASLRGRRLRAPEKRIRSLQRMSLFAVILALAEIVLSLIAGIVFWQLAAIALAGILIPLIHLIVLRTV